MLLNHLEEETKKIMSENLTVVNFQFEVTLRVEKRVEKTLIS